MGTDRQASMNNWDPPVVPRTVIPEVTDPANAATAPSSSSAAASRRKSRRPKFGFVLLVVVAVRGGRELLEWFAIRRYGWIALIPIVLAALAIMIGFNLFRQRVAARQGGVEMTDEQVRQQIADSGLDAPAFVEDGSLLGASVWVVNQRTKLVEVNTEYDVFGSNGRQLGTIEQIGQSRGKQIARIFTGFDQFFTHHFEIIDSADQVVLRMTRPRKWLRTRVEVFGPSDQFIGRLMQENVFGKIRFRMLDAAGQQVGSMRADNLKAWDFTVRDARDIEVAAVVKSWEGWMRTGLTKSDRYVVRVHEPLAEPLRSLTCAAALSVDVALKQDARAFG